MVNFCQILITMSVMISLQNGRKIKKNANIILLAFQMEKLIKDVSRQVLPYVLSDHD